MTDQVMPRYLPIDTYDAESPVLFINTHTELSDMAACAMHRFVVVRDLADTFASLNLKGISDCDLTRVMPREQAQALFEQLCRLDALESVRSLDRWMA